MEYQHYVGEGPEAEALIKECQDRKEAFRAAVRAFEEKHGFTETWQDSEEQLGGPALGVLDVNEAKAKGLVSHARMSEALIAYKPHKGTALGKQMVAEIAEINKLAFRTSRHITKVTGMERMLAGAHPASRTGMALAFSAAGYVGGKIVVKVPTGGGGPYDEAMPKPPPWLHEAKESEVLALYGK